MSILLAAAIVFGTITVADMNQFDGGASCEVFDLSGKRILYADLDGGMVKINGKTIYIVPDPQHTLGVGYRGVNVPARIRMHLGDPVLNQETESSTQKGVMVIGNSQVAVKQVCGA